VAPSGLRLGDTTTVNPADLSHVLSEWGYSALVLLLCATGVGSPIPEDVLLLAAGYLISAGVFWHPLVIALSIFGVVASDLMLYTWGRQMRVRADGRFIRFFRPRRLERATDWFDRFGDRIVLMARLLPGTRTVVFVGAGLRGMPVGRFLLHDTVGACIWVPVIVWLGTQLGEELGGLDRLFNDVGRLLWWLVAGAVVLALLRHFFRAEESKL
jgi:membrane protein DedA with SNARE-associated domain